MIAQQLAIAHHQMNIHRHGQDQHQRDEIGRNDRDLPAHQPEQTEHRGAGVEAACERQRHPAQFAKDEAHHRDQEQQHRAAEHQQIALDEAHHVVDDHRQAAEVELGLAAITGKDGADLGDGGACSDLVFFLGLFVVGAQVFELLLFGRRESAVDTFVEQIVTQIRQARQTGVVFKEDLDRADLAVGARDQIAI